MSRLPMSSLEIEREISVYFFILMIILIFISLWNINYGIYGIMIGILVYNLLPYENLKTANYYYFPKEKVLVILDKKDKRIEDIFDLIYRIGHGDPETTISNYSHLGLIKIIE